MFDMVPFVKNFMSPFDDNFFKSFWGEQNRAFSTDIKDNGTGYTLKADLPGFKKEDIHVDLDGDTLTVQAEHKESNDEKNDKGEYLRRERYYGSYARSFDVSEIDTTNITAAYNDGVLTLELPKKAPAQVDTSHQIEIQ